MGGIADLSLPVGAGLVGVAILDPNPKRSVGVALLGVGLGAFGLVRLLGRLPSFAEVVEFAQKPLFNRASPRESLVGIPGEFEITFASNPLLFKALRVKRQLAEAEAAGLTRAQARESIGIPPTEQLGASVRQGLLGKPTNIYRVSGRFQNPAEGSTVKGAAFSVLGMVENQSNMDQTGAVELQIDEKDEELGFTRSRKIAGPTVRLLPAQLQAIPFEVFSIEKAPSIVTLRLRFRGFTTATVTFERVA